MPHLWLFRLYVWLTKDLYRFFASAWIDKPAHTLEPPPGLLGEYSKVLDEVSPDLPPQLQAKLDDVRHELPRLFRSSYPMVLQHDDLLETIFMWMRLLAISQASVHTEFSFFSHLGVLWSDV
jgi:hypothetical protein